MTNNFGTFTCESCKGTFGKGRSDEEAMKEAEGQFGSELLEDEPGMVCDDCFEEMKKHFGWKFGAQA